MFPQFDDYYSNKQHLIGFITTPEDNDEKFLFIIIDSTTKTIISTFNYKAADIKTFIDEFPTPSNYKNIFKAFIINLYGLDLHSTGFEQPSNFFCKELKKKINDLKGVPSYFFSKPNYLYSWLLIVSNVEVKNDEEIVILIPAKSGFQLGQFKFTPNGYQLIQQKSIIVDFKAKPAILKQQILGTLKPTKIIFAASACYSKKFAYQKVFKGLDYFAYDCCPDCCRVKVVEEICKWLLDQTNCKFHIMPFSDKEIKIYGKFGTEKNIMDILKIEVDDPLPIKNTAIISKSVPEVYILIQLNYGLAEGEKILSKFCHKHEVTVTMDEDNIEKIEFQKNFIDDLRLSTFNNYLEKLEGKFPVIIFYDNSSVIALHKNNNNGYQFLKEWNGAFGHDLYISFDQKKPQFGEAAMEALKTKNTFVVYDLLKIMSMPPDEIKSEIYWGFTFTKDSQNPVLLDFNYFGGHRKSSSPEFLMAMSLRQHFKAIENECGQKPAKIAIRILEVKEFNKDEMKRIENGLKKACDLLKVECVFI